MFGLSLHPDFSGKRLALSRVGALQHALASTDASDFDSETMPDWFGLPLRFVRNSGDHESTGRELAACVHPEPFDTVRRHGFVWKQTIFLVWPLFDHQRALYCLANPLMWHNERHIIKSKAYTST